MPIVRFNLAGLTPAVSQALRQITVAPPAGRQEAEGFVFVDTAEDSYRRALQSTPAPRTRPARSGCGDRWLRIAPQLWRLLHERPGRIAVYPADPKVERRWLALFGGSIFCADCLAAWRLDVAANPPDLSSKAAYGRWTWARHNEVNRRRAVDQMPFEAADALYGWTQGADRRATNASIDM